MKYFDYSEFDQEGLAGSGKRYMCSKFLDQLDELRDRYGQPIIITSGYRSPEYNNKVSSTGLTGAHTTGKAVDIAVSRQDAYKLLQIVFDMGVFTGVGIQQKGSGRFIHLDTLSANDPRIIRPTIWSY